MSPGLGIGRQRLRSVARSAVAAVHPARLRAMPAVREIRRSGMFDAEFYRAAYPDVVRCGLDPVWHYVQHGAREGRAPHPLFDADFYRDQRPGIGTGYAALLDYIRTGAAIPSSPHPWFDTPFYLAGSAQAIPIGRLPLLHYLADGVRQGRDPHPRFATTWYLDTYPDVRSAGMNPLVHYVRSGARLGYLPSPGYEPELVGTPVPVLDPLDAGAGQRARLGTAVGRRRVKLVAFYLPQFHPIPENDTWWGTGFTEWRQVAKARPLYRGHRQPRLPADLGFYDLRLPEVRQAQAELALRHGLTAFCYYHYWFNGRRLLERPLAEVLASGEPDFPFCICWANENWTRRWNGQEQDLLMRQSYAGDWARRFIRDVIPMLKDPRYLRFEGKPVIVVYRARDIPDPNEALEVWRAECLAAGVGPVHIAAVRFWDIVDVQALGFDAAVDFPPHHFAVRDVAKDLPGLAPDFDGVAYDYGYGARQNLETRGHGYATPAHRGVMLAWDNSPRRGTTARIAHGATPELYREWLEGVLDQEMEHSSEPESLVFINAWNEWGEGATLEPDDQFGMRFLQATSDAMSSIVDRWAEVAVDATRRLP